MSSKNITHTELLIIGAGPAGVSTANFFARLNRPHVMYDSGLYRNAQSPAAHTIINYDGKNPAVWRQEGVAELLAKYGKGSSLGSNSSVDNDAKTSMGTLDYRRDTIVKLERQASVFDSWPGFSATDSSGNIVLARKVVLATGLKDHLPLSQAYRRHGERGRFTVSSAMERKLPINLSLSCSTLGIRSTPWRLRRRSSCGMG